MRNRHGFVSRAPWSGSPSRFGVRPIRLRAIPWPGATERVLFPTIDFAIFFGAVFLGHWLLNPHPVRWKVFMIAASYFFYGWWTISYVPLLAASSTIAQLGAVGIHHA